MDILAINPNSSVLVTRSMEECLADVQVGGGHSVRCIELAKSPIGIETDEHVQMVIPNILEAISASAADAFVVACFSDPGLEKVRKSTLKPVVGIAESAYLTSLALGQRFGIVSLGRASIDRHLRYLRLLRLDARLAGDRSIDMTVAELMQNDVMDVLTRVGQQLHHEDGADIIILGCAGLGSYRKALEARLGLPVVDPVQAGVALAASQLDLGYFALERN